MSDFANAVHEEKLEAHMENPNMTSDKRDDSFAFNFDLPAYISNSELSKKAQYVGDHPLIGNGFVTNVCKNFFTRQSQGLAMDLKFIVKHFKEQDSDIDFFAKNLKRHSETKEVEEINIDSLFNKDAPKTKTVAKSFMTESMTIHNNKNTYVGRVVLESVDGELDEILLYGHSHNKDLQVRIDYRNGFEHPRLEHYKYVGDINTFFGVVTQIIYGIRGI